jgi:hypothetical protein
LSFLKKLDLRFLLFSQVITIGLRQFSSLCAIWNLQKNWAFFISKIERLDSVEVLRRTHQQAQQHHGSNTTTTNSPIEQQPFGGSADKVVRAIPHSNGAVQFTHCGLGKGWHGWSRTTNTKRSS